MTDAFRCNGCGEYYDDHYRFVEATFSADAVTVSDFTYDDMPTEAFGLFEGDISSDEHRCDLCHNCGREAIELLVEAFGEAD